MAADAFVYPDGVRPHRYEIERNYDLADAPLCLRPFVYVVEKGRMLWPKGKDVEVEKECVNFTVDTVEDVLRLIEGIRSGRLDLGDLAILDEKLRTGSW